MQLDPDKGPNRTSMTYTVAMVAPAKLTLNVVAVGECRSEAMPVGRQVGHSEVRSVPTILHGPSNGYDDACELCHKASGSVRACGPRLGDVRKAMEVS